MKLQPDQFDAPSISSYGPGWITIAGEKIDASIVLGSRGQRFAWDCAAFEQLSAEHFARLVEPGVEMVIFGSGCALRFPKPEWTRPLVAAQIGIETMDTQAACRTYNILAGEGRNVVVALLLEPPAPLTGA
ncbi:MAG: Mth938-like domain-containing protein [Burkholderiales bacterium]